MSLFTKLVKKSISDYLRRRKKWLISATLFIGLLIGVNLVLNHYVDKVVGTLIKEFVHEKSKGFYKVDFKDIAYILNSGRFYMSEFQFAIHPDHEKNLDNDKLNQKYLYAANIPKLHIDIIDFWSIFVNKKLRVIGVEVISPHIKIINLNKNKNPKKISFEAGNLYEVLSGHLDELKVNDFLISDGEFDYETYNGPDYDNFKIKGVTFEVNNFKVNEQASTRTDKIFYTDDIFLEIKDQLLYLKDSIHKVTFDKFYISTSDNEFGFENFNLTRRENTHANVKIHDHYEISLPILRLSGIDFLKAYNNNLLMIDSLQIHDPTINVKKRIKSQRKDSTRNSLLDVAMMYHESLMIDHFSLEDAHFIFTDETKDLPKQYSIDHISAHITKVEIDTDSNSKYQYGFNFDEADLTVNDYEVNLPDSVNTVKFEEFSISSNPFVIKLKDLSINPNIASSTTHEKSMLFASIPYLVITDFDIAKAINMDTFLIDEIYIENPEIKVIPSAKKNSTQKNNSPGGLFGAYESIKSISDYFLIEELNLVNGKFELENRSNNNLNMLTFNDINLSVSNLIVDSLTDTESDILGDIDVALSMNNSSVDLAQGKVELNKIAFNSLNGRLKVDNLKVSSDTTSKHDQIFNINLPELIITGINPNEIFYENKVSLDTLKFQDVSVFVDFLVDQSSTKTENQKLKTITPPISINYLIGIDYDIDVREKGFPLFQANNINFNIANLTLDQSLSDNPLNQFDYDKINLISIDDYDLYLRNQNHLFEAEHILWLNDVSTFSMENISLKPFGVANNRYDIDIPKITMTGINLKKILKESFYDGEEIIIDHPKINLKLAQGRQEKMTSLDLGFIPVLLRNRYLGAKAKSFDVRDAEIYFHQKIENDSLILEAENFNLLVDNFEVDSTTEMLPDRFLFANDVRLHGDYISAFHQSNSDFYNINHYYVSTKEGEIRLNGVYYSINTKNEFPDKGKMKLSIENLNLLGFDFFDLTQNRTLDIAEIQIDNADFQITKNPVANANGQKRDSINREMQKYHLENTPNQQLPSESRILEDISKTLEKELLKSKPVVVEKKNNLSSSEFPFDTLLLKNIDIGRILLTDSKVNFETTDDHNTGLVVPDIWFLAEGIHYNPVSAKDSSRIFYSDNVMAKITNINYVLPDNLSSIKVDELIVNSTDSTIKAINFALLPLVSKYDYGPAKGFQSTWLQIENDSITLEKVDFLGIINNNKLTAQSLNVNKIDISVFRDKRVPFPEWQRRPLPQSSLRDLKFTFGIDTIQLTDGYITYQEHSEKAYTTGEVFFSELDALILNLTNDSARIQLYPKARIGVSTKIFDEGAIKGEFLFDLVDMENIHSYGIDVEPFDLTEFNRILIPSASVQISSGDNKRIIMTARANEHYSYGEMKFYYEDLKIKLLNRETETPKGLGNVLGSFFANTFIIKSNNPRNLFLRKGDIFYERDKKRAIFNYWTKTFLSGVVSSIGATNNKKKIKKMQEENLKKIQAEKKELSSL